MNLQTKSYCQIIPPASSVKLEDSSGLHWMIGKAITGRRYGYMSKGIGKRSLAGANPTAASFLPLLGSQEINY
jgi:hypothetical protein